jgi:beta-galactosidase
MFTRQARLIGLFLLAAVALCARAGTENTLNGWEINPAWDDVNAVDEGILFGTDGGMIWPEPGGIHLSGSGMIGDLRAAFNLRLVEAGSANWFHFNFRKAAQSSHHFDSGGYSVRIESHLIRLVAGSNQPLLSVDLQSVLGSGFSFLNEVARVEVTVIGEMLSVSVDGVAVLETNLRMLNEELYADRGWVNFFNAPNRGAYSMDTINLEILDQPNLHKGADVHRLDVSTQPPLNPEAPSLSHWGGANPSGATISANRFALLLDGQVMPATVGEIHPQRYPAALWEEAILEMKAGGLNTIGAYWFWTFIEPRPGQFDFTGRNDVRAFLDLCRKHDMLVFARIGPFCNAEILCGGLPPWIFGMPLIERSNDPRYLELVNRYYHAIAEQMQGFYWQDGGPVFMVQVENELSRAANVWRMVYRHGASEEHRGPEDAAGFAEHYETLREMAVGAGINPPLFAATCWGGAQRKFEEIGTTNFFFCHGGYMYLGPPGKENSHLTVIQPNPFYLNAPVPVGFIELGAAGSPARLGYVPQPPVESAVSTGIARLGAAPSAMVGWYMYHGGTNPLHPDWGFSAKHEDLALLSYDYNAPLSEFGVPRPAYYHLRPMHQTVLNFAPTFTGGAVVFDNPLAKPGDDRLRLSVRKGPDDGGAVILLHYGNITPLSDRQAAIELKTASGGVRIPSEGSLDLENGDFAILPFNLDFGGGVKLISATAQLSGRIRHGTTEAVFCSSIRDQEAEFVLALPPGAKVASEGRVREAGGKTVVRLDPAMDAQVVVTRPDGSRLMFVLLPGEAIRHSVEAVLGGQKTYLISDQDIVVDGSTVRLTSTSTNEFELLAWPPVSWKDGVSEGNVGMFQRTTLSVPSRDIRPEIVETSDKKWLVQLPTEAFNGVHDIYAHVDFDGLICRIFDQESGLPVGDQLNAPNLVWQVGLKRFAKVLGGPGLVFFATREDHNTRQMMSDGGMLLDHKTVSRQDSRLKAITFHPEYRAEFIVR